MILYSIVPSEIVFENRNAGNYVNLIEIQYMGETLEVSPVENNQFIINRIISTSLKAYLNAKLQPGTIIKGIIPR